VGRRLVCGAEEFLKWDRSETADCVALGPQMRRPSGLDFQKALAQSKDPSPVIFATVHGEISSSVRAMKQARLMSLSSRVPFWAL
jgi:FixJ family two-component response regulator